jgi:hypothetical protein
MSQPSIFDATVCQADSSLTNQSDVVRASLVLLHEMETSLEASQRALLRGDAAGMETGTREQRRLQRALELLWAMDRSRSCPDDPKNIGRAAEISFPRPAPESMSELSGELRAAQLRVLHLGRVQAVLLRRAQQSLVVLGNMLAGTGASYSPAAHASWTPTASAPIKKMRKGEEVQRCRA